MMRRILLAMMGAAAPMAGWAQTHVIQRPEQVVRATAVYEWTGEEGKATASRVVPVALFIDGQFEDAGIYLSRPVPFALDTGTVFEVQKAGAPEGTVDLAYERNYVGDGLGSFDAGWEGYGKLKLVAKEPAMAAKKSGPLPVVVASGGSRPHFSSKPDADPASGSEPKEVDRSSAAGGGTTVAAGPVADDSNRPTMRRRTDSSDADSAKGDSTDDAERPTLKRRTPAEMKDAKKKGDQASVTGTGELNDDPDRPTLHRGAAGTKTDEQNLPPLQGIPKDMHQRVAVSDARDRPEHEFARTWGSDAERAEILQVLRSIGSDRLTKYGDALVSPVPVSPVVATSVGARRGGKKRAAVPASVPASVELTAESVRGFTLSYGGAATFVYEGTSPGAGGGSRYVTVIAQQEPGGELKVALASVTDSTHLDRTPWMRLVDVVDADASNRASLLVELRGERTRQFALYRVIGARAEQVFATAAAE